MSSDLQHKQPSRISGMIHCVRGSRVMLDSDLAVLYGVTTKRLKEQLKRNRDRFPDDFAFELTRKEAAALSPQSGKTAGGRRYLPWAFTEHGAVMLASVLSTPIAVEAGIRVVRAFVHLREMLASNREMASKLAELERRMGSHDHAIRQLFDAINRLLDPPETEEEPREIGFHIKEESWKYTTCHGVN